MQRVYLWIFTWITPFVSFCSITTALLMLGADKIPDKMLTWCLNTQFNVFGVFRVAVEHLGPLITQLIFCSTTQTRFLFFFFKPWGEFGTCQRDETSPTKENHADIYWQGEGKWWSNKSWTAWMENQTLTPLRMMSRVLCSSSWQTQQCLAKVKSRLSFCLLLQYSRGLGVSSGLTFNGEVLIKGVGNLGVGLLCDGWKLGNWTQRRIGLKHCSSQTGLPLSGEGQWQECIIAAERGGEEEHHLPGRDKDLWSLSLPQGPKKGLAEGQCHPHPPPNPPRAELGPRQSQSQSQSMGLCLANLFLGEVRTGFNPATDAHTWRSKLLPPSWIKLAGKAMECKAGLMPAPGCSCVVTHGGCTGFLLFLRELNLTKACVTEEGECSLHWSWDNRITPLL